MMGKAERLISDAGCGMFQILIILLVYVFFNHPLPFAMMFMSYGNFNPGWRCLTYMNTTSNVYSNLTSVETTENGNMMPYAVSDSPYGTSTVFRRMNQTQGQGYSSQHSCEAYLACEQIEFNPEASTIITEWHLVCDKASYSSLIISIQMLGIFFGTFIAGFLGDFIGRKKTLYSSILCVAILNFLTVLSTSWQIFALMRFLLGVMLAGSLTMNYLLPSEFLDTKWRARVAAIPAWNNGGIFFTLAAMLLKDWRYLHIITGISCLIICIPVFWVPESLRWLEVKNKPEEFKKVARKIISLNKNKGLDFNDYSYDLTPGINGDVDVIIEQNGDKQEIYGKTSKKRYKTLDIFRKGYRMQSLTLAATWASGSLVYYAISFGIKALYGDIYINMIIMYSLTIPFTIFPYYLPNKLGRKASVIIFYSVCGACLLSATCFEVWASMEVKKTGTLVLALLAILCSSAIWSPMAVFTGELYPTCVRSIGLNYGSLNARLGGILAPFLIPKTPETLYICYLAMGIVCVVCCLLVSRLPETKGRKLKETFEDDEEE